MIATLVPMSVARERDANLATVSEYVANATEAGIVLFPEAALGPFPTGRFPEKDLPLGESIPGPVTEALCESAKQHRRWIGIGLLERCGHRLYDSAVLIDPSGTVALHYRRIHTGWFYPAADTSVYCTGRELPVAVTPAGRTALLICGDIFGDEVADRAAALDLDLLLVPMARSLAGTVETWEGEIPEYQARVARIGVPALIVNRSDGAFVGGAMALSADGEVRLKLLPTQRQEPLTITVPLFT